MYVNIKSDLPQVSSIHSGVCSLNNVHIPSNKLEIFLPTSWKYSYQQVGNIPTNNSSGKYSHSIIFRSEVVLTFEWILQSFIFTCITSKLVPPSSLKILECAPGIFLGRPLFLFTPSPLLPLPSPLTAAAPGWGNVFFRSFTKTDRFFNLPLLLPCPLLEPWTSPVAPSSCNMRCCTKPLPIPKFVAIPKLLPIPSSLSLSDWPWSTLWGKWSAIPLKNATNAVLRIPHRVIFCFHEMLTDICPTNRSAGQVATANQRPPTCFASTLPWPDKRKESTQDFTKVGNTFLLDEYGYFGEYSKSSESGGWSETQQVE